MSTRRVETLVQQLGIRGISKSQVSVMAKSLDEEVKAFCAEDGAAWTTFLRGLVARG